MESFATNMVAFFKLHRDIPREGPGNDEATRRAIRGLRPLPPDPVILEMGCGPGKQTLVLARELGHPITAMDFHQPYLDRLELAAREQGLDRLITTRCHDMTSPDVPHGSVDLIWAEGSIFIMGFFQGLIRWHTLLRDGGQLVASELTWLTDDPPVEAQAFWKEECPTMTTIEGNIASADDAGYEVFDHFVLERAGWWDEYLSPLGERARELRPLAAQDKQLAQVIEQTEREIDICRRLGDSFGYVYYLMQKRG